MSHPRASNANAMRQPRWMSIPGSSSITRMQSKKHYFCVLFESRIMKQIGNLKN
jgi:hypothetical protein